MQIRGIVGHDCCTGRIFGIFGKVAPARLANVLNGQEGGSPRSGGRDTPPIAGRFSSLGLPVP